MKTQAPSYKTHWHSFWFGFMSALAVVLLCLLIGTIFGYMSFNKIHTKRVPISTTQDNKEKSNETSPSITQLVHDIGIDESAFEQCMTENRYADAVQADIDSGIKAGVKGTPHSFVLIDDAIYEIPGAYEEKGMREFFDDLLAGNAPRAKDIHQTTDLAPVDENDWIRGSDNARITVIEYTDLDCPFCKKFHKSTTNMINDYHDSVRWVFRHMPSDGLHPQARTKAQAAECVGELGGAESFWKYIDISLNSTDAI